MFLHSHWSHSWAVRRQSNSEEASRFTEIGHRAPGNQQRTRQRDPQERSLARPRGLPSSPLKAGFLVGGQRGHGIMSVRDRNAGNWSSPRHLLTGGSFGAQIGGQATYLGWSLNRRTDNLLSNEFKMPGLVPVAAGPDRGEHRHPASCPDPQLFARTRAVRRHHAQRMAIREDEDANRRFYNAPLRTRQIVLDAKALTSSRAELHEPPEKLAG